MRLTALLLVPALLTGCLAEPGGAPLEPALDQVASDVSPLGREIAARRAGRERPAAERQPPHPVQLTPAPQVAPGQQPRDHQATAGAVSGSDQPTWPQAWTDQWSAGPPPAAAATAPAATLTRCCWVIPLPDAADADPAFPLPVPGHDPLPAPDRLGRDTPGLVGQAHPGSEGGYEAIRFRTRAVAELVGPAGEARGLFLIQEGARLRARVTPAWGVWPEAADLLFEDGTAARRVPRAAFIPAARAPQAGTPAGDDSPGPR